MPVSVHTYTINEVVTSADLNAIQSTAASVTELGVVDTKLTAFTTNMNGLLMGKLDMTVTSSTVTVGDISTIVIGGQAYTKASVTMPIAATLGSTPAASTCYYVYAFISAGVVQYQISTTEPHYGLTWKNNSGLPVLTHRYIGCFGTDTAGAVIPCRKVGNHYMLTGAASYGIGGLAATAWTDIILGNNGGNRFMPPHARRAQVNVTCVGSFPVSFRENGTTDVFGQAHVDGGQQLVVSLDTDTLQTVEYKNGGSGSNVTTVYVLGFWE